MADAERFNANRVVDEDAYRAEIRITAGRPVLFAGVVAHLEILVRNLGGERWPPGHHAAPLIRPAYRWLSADGTRTLVPEGLRTPFEETVEPGEETVVMLAVLAPDEPGEYVLEVDLVHELVRWFETPARVPLDGRAVRRRRQRLRRRAPRRGAHRAVAQLGFTRCRQATASAATTPSSPTPPLVKWSR